jgi:hypothetical protein
MRSDAKGLCPLTPPKNLLKKGSLESPKPFENFYAKFPASAAVPERLQRIHGAPAPFDNESR